MQIKQIDAILDLPGDKSISHRSLMLASLTRGECVIHNISTGIDVETTRKCLERCGIYSNKKDNTISIIGSPFISPKDALDCGNSGTTVRLLAGLLAGKNISASFTGDKSLSKRPMNRIMAPLMQMGAQFNSNNGRLPIQMQCNTLKGINYTLDVASAQVKSAIILAGLGAEGKTFIHETLKTRDHTEIMLQEIGADITLDKAIEVNGTVKPMHSFDIAVPGDPSSSAFFCALAAMLPNSSLRINNILANPTRVGFFNLLKKMGTIINWKNMRKECGELVGDVYIHSQPLNGVDITKDMIPSLIDELPIIAILASQADSPTTVSGAEELRVKETDRIHAISMNLSNMGCKIIEKKDGFIIDPINTLHNTTITTFGDHRIAMAFAIAGCITSEKNVLDDQNCINISFPEFNDILNTILL